MPAKTAIKSFYPKAEEGEAVTSRLMKELNEKHGFENKKTILATSVCSDEVIQSATNFRDYVALEQPFQIGGLAGFPFTGLTGLKAFAGHVPDDGFAIILYGPHIGISEKDHLGKVIRSGQTLETSCCGALMGVLGTFKDGSEDEIDETLDYQQWTLTKQLSDSRDTIIESSDPLIPTTNRMFERIDERIKTLVDETSDHFKGNKIALIGGIIINTDYGHPDWFELREFSVRTF